MTDRYTTIYDENDWILDEETGEYLTIEEACILLNQYYNDLMKCVGFSKTFLTLLDEATKEGGR
jgi:hypothetical protein